MSELTQDDLAAYAADAATPETGGDNILARITRVAAALREAQGDVAQAEEGLKAAQERARVLQDIDLPALMDEAQQERLRTSDGFDLERSETLRASISAANMPKAVMYLRGIGQGSIVKRKVETEFGKGEDQKAAEAVDLLKDAGFTPTDKYSVHPQTLAATVRELIAEGKEVDMGLLGVFIQPTVKMKSAEAPKAKASRRKAS